MARRSGKAPTGVGVCQLVAVAFAALLAAAPAAAVDYVWNNAAGGNWNTAANWTPNGLVADPGAFGSFLACPAFRCGRALQGCGPVPCGRELLLGARAVKREGEQEEDDVDQGEGEAHVGRAPYPPLLVADGDDEGDHGWTCRRGDLDRS